MTIRLWILNPYLSNVADHQANPIFSATWSSALRPHPQHYQCKERLNRVIFNVNGHYASGSACWRLLLDDVWTVLLEITIVLRACRKRYLPVSCVVLLSALFYITFSSFLTYSFMQTINLINQSIKKISQSYSIRRQVDHPSRRTAATWANVGWLTYSGF